MLLNPSFYFKIEGSDLNKLFYNPDPNLFYLFRIRIRICFLHHNMCIYVYVCEHINGRFFLNPGFDFKLQVRI